MNQAIIIGRLTRDPELRYTVPVAKFSVAVHRDYTNQQGDRETDFLDIFMWRKLAETVADTSGRGASSASRAGSRFGPMRLRTARRSGSLGFQFT